MYREGEGEPAGSVRQAPDGRKGFTFISDPAVPAMVPTLAVLGQIPDRIGQTGVVVLRLRSSLAANLPGVRSGARDARPSHLAFTLSVEGLLFTPGRCRGATGRGQAAKGAPGAPPGVPRRPRATWAPPPGVGKGIN